MGLQQTPRKRRSPWAIYGPIIAVVVIVAIVIAIVASNGSSSKNKSVSVGNGSGSSATAASGQNGVPIFYNDAKAKGELDKYTWQDDCDKTTGYVAVPVLNPPPCVPKFTGNNGGATSPGVTGDAIKVGYYIAKPDPLLDASLKATGTYDPPDKTDKVTQAYFHLYEKLFELYGRHLQLVRIDGTGTSSDAVAARADADKAAAAGVFAVIGGPGQAKQFGDELAQKHILCLGGCIVAQPQQYILDHEPYMWPIGPTPDETSTLVTDLIKNQLLGKPAQWAGPAIVGKPRTFTMLTYNTPDGQYTASWDDLRKKMDAIGAKVVSHVDYYLNLPTLQADARTIAAKLKQANATDILFTGDPIFPQYLTKEMTKQGYFPEWVLSGTVLADTVAFAKSFDQQQWKHAFGLNLSHPLTVKTDQDAYTLHKWWYGTPPESDNNYGVVNAPIEMFMEGLQTAGPNLTPQSFKNGIYAVPPNVPAGTPTPSPIITYGNHGLWPGLADDPGGGDNVSLLWWDPTVNGVDEVGNPAHGQYRVLNNGARYTAANFPTDPLPFFNPANTVTVYQAGHPPADLVPKSYPVPADAPAAQGSQSTSTTG